MFHLQGFVCDDYGRTFSLIDLMIVVNLVFVKVCIKFIFVVCVFVRLRNILASRFLIHSEGTIKDFSPGGS